MIDIASVARALEQKRGQDHEWDGKTRRQARFIFDLFARFMRETRGIVAFSAVTQADLASFDAFLRSLHANFGKSTKNPRRSIREITALAAIEVPKKGALQGPTRNRHLAFLNQLIAYGRSGLGIALDPALTTTPFRARKDRRGRDQRPVPPKAGIETFFRRPLFTGYASWDDIDTPGDEFFHRGEYYTTSSIDLRPGQWSTVSNAQLARLHYSGRSRGREYRQCAAVSRRRPVFDRRRRRRVGWRRHYRQRDSQQALWG